MLPLTWPAAVLLHLSRKCSSDTMLQGIFCVAMQPGKPRPWEVPAPSDRFSPEGSPASRVLAAEFYSVELRYSESAEPLPFFLKRSTFQLPARTEKCFPVYSGKQERKNDFHQRTDLYMSSSHIFFFDSLFPESFPQVFCWGSSAFSTSSLFPFFFPFFLWVCSIFWCFG